MINNSSLFSKFNHSLKFRIFRPSFSINEVNGFIGIDTTLLNLSDKLVYLDAAADFFFPGNNTKETLKLKFPYVEESKMAKFLLFLNSTRDQSKTPL